MSDPGPSLAIVVKGYPRLSETFIARELEGLEGRGLRFSLHALRNPGEDAALTRYRLQTHCQYLPEYLHDAPISVLRAVMSSVRLPGFHRAWTLFRRDLAKDPSRARFRRFGQACVLANSIKSHARHIYCHFSHSPASVTRYAAALLSIGYSISAHAKDAWTDPAWDLSAKLEDARMVVTCNTAARQRLESLVPSRAVQLIHHGIDRSLVVARACGSGRDGGDSDNPVRVLAVARAVEKKGLRHLLDALSLLPPGLHYRLDHFGGGPLLPSLKVTAQASGIADKITFHGATAHEQIIAAMDRSDILVFPADVAADGDRDGIPNVILEANARGLCVIACKAGGVGEVVEDGVTGALIERADAAALSAQIERAIRQPALRQQWAESALTINMQRFDAEAGHERLAQMLRAEVGAS
jgi:glycosyltransferase involved in cell wall biosynthesis